jgi:hypothetical protein
MAAAVPEIPKSEILRANVCRTCVERVVFGSSRAYTADDCSAVFAMGMRRVMTMPLPWLTIHCLVGGRQDLFCLNGVVPAQAKGVYVALKWR